MNDALDFFKMRRCVEDLHPDPKFPGCVYSEMKMCLAPCFRGCTDDEYRAEVVRVEDFLDSRGESLKRQMATERDRASRKWRSKTAAACMRGSTNSRPCSSRCRNLFGASTRCAP